MNIQALKLVCFSPTGTTKKIVKGIACGIKINHVQLINITRPEIRKQQLLISENELLVVGIPVYMGRVPALLKEWLCNLKAPNTPVVCVVVYGNRVYDDALLELKNILKARGCIPIAGAAFIGEHSFSSKNLPIAESRPDLSDLNLAESFGHNIIKKLRTYSSVDHISELNVPGNHPYGGITELWSVDFIAVGDECIQCGFCAEVCPVDAIDPGKSDLIDVEKCITCCACIKSCPQNARSIKNGLVKDAATRLNIMYQDRKEPEFFI
jgi:ferredoxin